MTRPHLEVIWIGATEEERIRATTEARVTLKNLVHYPKKTKQHTDDDVRYLAAQLLAFQKTGVANA